MLYTHQRTGADWLACRTRACLADDPGLGKTITAVVAADRARAHRMLVVAPTCVIWNWRREIEKWSPLRAPLVIASGADANLAGQSDTVITTHGLLLSPKVRAALLRQRWDVCVLDESHFFRGRGAKRSAIFYGLNRVPLSIAATSERVWCLSGTPMPNNATDLWTMAHGLWPADFSEAFESFRGHFCATTWSPYGDNVKVIGNKNLDKLRERLTGKILRRRADEALDLPDIRYETVALRPDKMPHEIQRLAAELPPALVSALAEERTAEQAFEVLGTSKAFAAFRRLCGLAKADATAALLEHELQDGQLDKVVVFAHHKDVVDAIARSLARFGVRTITGATGAARRTAYVDDFQTRDDVRVIVCNILAGGTGTTLTAASELVFAEMSFVPGENTQAAIRIRRIGQEHKCRVRFVTLAGTLDEALVGVLQRKTQMIREVIDAPHSPRP